MSDMLSVAAARLSDGIGEAADLPAGPRRDKKTRSLLVHLHRDVMRAAAGVDEKPPPELHEVATAVQDRLADAVENKLSIRERVFVRLIRAGALEPAWTLAGDNSAGVIPTSRAGLKWAGGPENRGAALRLPTLIEHGTVFAWLPGFRDPRWGLPDSVYEITDSITLHLTLEQISLERGQLNLGGAGYFTILSARADDDVTVVLTGPGGQERRAPAQRARTPEYLSRSGSELTRLAWAGWHATVDVGTWARTPGTWSLSIELAQADLRRRQPLGPDCGPYAETVNGCGPTEAQGKVFRVKREKNDHLSLSVSPLGPSARMVPRPVRAALRQVIPRS